MDSKKFIIFNDSKKHRIDLNYIRGYVFLEGGHNYEDRILFDFKNIKESESIYYSKSNRSYLDTDMKRLDEYFLGKNGGRR
jgi:hypothetical protein